MNDDRDHGVTQEVTSHRHQQHQATPHDVRVSSEQQATDGTDGVAQDLQVHQKVCTPILDLAPEKAIMITVNTFTPLLLLLLLILLRGNKAIRGGEGEEEKEEWEEEEVSQLVCGL